MTVSKLSVGLGPIETGIKVFENIYLNVQRAATTRQEITTMLACCWEIQRGRGLCLARLQCLKSSSHVSPPAFLDNGDDELNNMATVQDKPSPRYIVTCLPDLIFVFFCKY